MSSKDFANIAQGIMTLLPLAEAIVFSIGGKLVELNTQEIKSAEDVIKLLEASKSSSFPKFKFNSGGSGQ